MKLFQILLWHKMCVCFLEPCPTPFNLLSTPLPFSLSALPHSLHFAVRSVQSIMISYFSLPSLACHHSRFARIPSVQEAKLKPRRAINDIRLTHYWSTVCNLVASSSLSSPAVCLCHEAIMVMDFAWFAQYWLVIKSGRCSPYFSGIIFCLLSAPISLVSLS